MELDPEVAAALKETGAEVLLNFLPVGSQDATEFYMECALEAGVAQEKFLKSVCTPGADPAALDIESMHPRILREIAPILAPFLPNGLHNGYDQGGGSS